MEEINVICPYCCESFTALIDPSEPSSSYTEDCYVCCRPIVFHVEVENGEVQSVNTSRENG